MLTAKRMNNSNRVINGDNQGIDGTCLKLTVSGSNNEKLIMNGESESEIDEVVVIDNKRRRLDLNNDGSLSVVSVGGLVIAQSFELSNVDQSGSKNRSVVGPGSHAHLHQ